MRPVACGALLRELRRCCTSTRIDVDGTHARRAARASRRTGSTAKVIRRSTSRSRRSAAWSRCRHPGARRRDLQARRRDAGAVRARGPRRGVRRAGGSAAPHRRSGPRRAADDILVLKNAGPHGGRHAGGRLSADPEETGAGGRQGHGAHLRRADERHGLSGPSCCTSRPRPAIGGPLAAVRNGDRIALSVANKRIDLLVDDSKIKRRLESWSPPPVPPRGYAALFRRSVLQASGGCDFDFLTGVSSNK